MFLFPQPMFFLQCETERFTPTSRTSNVMIICILMFILVFRCIKNQCIREKTEAQNIVKEIKRYQEKWQQHVQRMDTNIIPKQALQYKTKG
jgi:hypothetical protein